MYLGSFNIDDYVGIPADCHRFSSGAAYAPTALTYSIYEDATAVGLDEDVDMVVASPFDAIVGHYWIRRQLTAAAGFEAGKNYHVVVKATVDSVAAIMTHTFQILAKVNAISVPSVTLANGAHGGAAATITLQTPIAATVPNTQKVDVETIKTQAVICAAGVTVLAQVGAAGAPGANNGLPTTNGTKLNQTVDLTAGQSIGISGDFSATMKTSVTQQTGYQLGAVWFDTAGVAGAVSYVNGIVTNPCSSPTNTHTLLANLNLKVVRVVNASGYTLEATYTGVSFIGEKWTLALANQNITNCYFEGATVSGTTNAAGTGNQFTECQIGAVTMAAGATQVSACTLRSCGLTGTFTIGAAGIFTFEGCYNEISAAGVWILDFAAVGATTVRLAGFSGSVEVRNMAAGDVLVVEGSGAVTLAATCAAGTVYIRGNFELTNASAITPTDTSRWNEDQLMASIAGAVGSVTGAVGSVTGAVGSVTGNVGGSVASVTGNVGGSVASVVGAVGSVTGNVGGSVASVVGAVGSVTGAVGSVTGAVGSVTGAVGSVTGNVGGSVGSVAGNVVGSVGSVTAPVTIAASQLFVKRATALTITFPMNDSVNHVPTPLLAVVARRSIDGGALWGATNLVVEVGSGVYSLLLSAADLNGACITFEFTAPGADTRHLTVITQA